MFPKSRCFSSKTLRRTERFKYPTTSTTSKCCTTVSMNLLLPDRYNFHLSLSLSPLSLSMSLSNSDIFVLSSVLARCCLTSAQSRASIQVQVQGILSASFSRPSDPLSGRIGRSSGAVLRNSSLVLVVDDTVLCRLRSAMGHLWAESRPAAVVLSSMSHMTKGYDSCKCFSSPA